MVLHIVGKAKNLIWPHEFFTFTGRFCGGLLKKTLDLTYFNFKINLKTVTLVNEKFKNGRYR
ncbi:hypothetical protein BpHYR1_001909 [Brachionus plicatilis]|uniref:Uncharacterized protein n=1 Tax=Brachionus plicatilis TaxID=10195 RepID=A0A3M7SJW8_BRAPC|nr:hypothetical protein BpHYR1_001909 [Brachionus plicatilis]